MKVGSVICTHTSPADSFILIYSICKGIDYLGHEAAKSELLLLHVITTIRNAKAFNSAQ
ncbi:MAG TPA: hypothetical protein VE643_09580 [Nitrososphaeraceae archaeon]|nr:hypothetical protein [Nitrososphaeraceae archaeon]